MRGFSSRIMRGASAEFQKRILRMVCCSTASKGSRELRPGVEREVVNRVQLDVRAAIPE